MPRIQTSQKVLGSLGMLLAVLLFDVACSSGGVSQVSYS